MNTITDFGSNTIHTYTSIGAGAVGAGGNGGLYWGTNGTSVSPGQVLTTNGTSSNWATVTADPNLQGSTLKVMGNAEFEGNVKIKGKDLADMFEKIEERLAILHPNPELEEKWDNLRALRNSYMELEAEIKEKEKVWGILKK
jgi:hypothetical protein